MNEKEIGELRRRLRPDRHNIRHICGCYVSEKGEIISTFDQSLGLMPEDELEKYLAIFKKVLSGPIHRNLLDITFQTSQVAEGAEHRLLMQLRDSALREPSILESFFQKVMESVAFESNYVILLAHDVYDVPFRAKDGTTLDDAGSTFSYLLCAVCPVKMTKPALKYIPSESLFHNKGTDFVVSPPDLGFLFPAFDGRRTNLYNALLYTRNTAVSPDNFVDHIFKSEIPMPADEQKDAFRSVLSHALEEECSMELVQAVHTELCERMEAHKSAHELDPLVVTRNDIQGVLESCNVSEEKVASFNVKFDNAFGTYAEVSPRNIVDKKQIEVRTPDVVIRVNADRRDLIQTRTIGGSKYIMILADDAVEVNGVNIHIEE